MRKRPTRPTLEIIAVIADMAADGETQTAIARITGASVRSVQRWAKLSGIPLLGRSDANLKAWSDDDRRRLRTESMTVKNRDPCVIAKQMASRRGIGVEKPSWLPLESWSDYLDMTFMFGESTAARAFRSN